MSIQHNKKRPNKPWIVRWFENDKQRSLSFRTRREASAFDEQRRVQVRTGNYISLDDQEILFSDYAGRYLQSGNREVSTLIRHEGILKKHVFPEIGQQRIHLIKRSDVQRLVDEWVLKGLQRRTIDRHLAVLSGIFRLAEADGLISRNPVVKIVRPSASTPHRRALTSDEIQRLVSELPDEYQSLIYVAIETGMRWGELANLNICNLDIFDQRIEVVKSKTSAGVRTIPISMKAISLINEHLMASGRTGANGDEPLFISHAVDPVTNLIAGRRLNYSNFRSRVFKPAAIRAGLGDLTIHDLRRTSATLLVDNGASPKVTQERLGHADIRTTLNLYAQGTSEGHQSALQGLESAILGTKESILTRVQA